MSRLRVAEVGIRGKGGQHMEILSGFEEVELVAVCDTVPEILESVGGKFGISRRYSSVDQLLDGEELDAVFIATPPEFNAPVALPCLERGVNTFLEKPPGMTAGGGKGTRRGRREIRCQRHGGFESTFSSHAHPGAGDGGRTGAGNTAGGGISQTHVGTRKDEPVPTRGHGQLAGGKRYPRRRYGAQNGRRRGPRGSQLCTPPPFPSTAMCTRRWWCSKTTASPATASTILRRRGSSATRSTATTSRLTWRGFA